MRSMPSTKSCTTTRDPRLANLSLKCSSTNSNNNSNNNNISITDKFVIDSDRLFSGRLVNRPDYTTSKTESSGLALVASVMILSSCRARYTGRCRMFIICKSFIPIATPLSTRCGAGACF